MSPRFLSVCSGLEGASLALEPLGFSAVGFAEIEPFPSAIISHHYGSNMPGEPLSHNAPPNFGDFTTIDVETLGQVDVLIGGTPCQAFSVAGKRLSLADARGNLTLAYAVLAHELARSNGLRNCIWENVPGVLSAQDNAFGCFLGAIVGADDALHTPDGGSWPDAGMVAGIRARAAWRVLDAQYFGLAQRRRRVFVVADFGNGADPAAVLFEPKSLCGNYPPSREKGQRPAPTISARTQGGGGMGADFECDGGLIAAEVAPTLDTKYGDKRGLENQHIDGGCGLFVAKPIFATSGQTNARIGIDIALTLTTLDEAPYVAHVACDVADSLTVGANQTTGFVGDVVAHTLRGEGFDASEDGSGRGTPIVPVAFDARQSEVCIYGDRAGAIDTDGHSQAICFSSKDHGSDATNDLAPTMRAMPHDGSHANGGGQLAVAIGADLYNGENTGDVAATMGTRGSSVNSPGPTLLHNWAVRRLTPEECEKLQGVPVGYTRIPWRGKPPEQCPDGPRYKALGNSWAVPVVAWIGRRLLKNMPNGSAVK